MTTKERLDHGSRSSLDKPLPLSMPDDSAPPEAGATAARRKKKENRSCGDRLTWMARSAFHLVKSEVGLIILLVIYSAIGSVIFVTIEGSAEDKEAAEASNTTVKMQRKTFAEAILKLTLCGKTENEVADSIQEFLLDYEIFPVEFFHQNQVNETLESEVFTKQWTYFGALLFCGTVFTTVGYGNIVPKTDAGRIATMIYAAIGIPLCLVVLTKVGKALTRAIKFLWSFVRRFYYTGSCFRIRKQIGWRKLSLGEKLRLRMRQKATVLSSKVLYVPYGVDDKFNLPPIVALLIAILYIFLGAFLYTRWENWTYLEAIYFTFTSLATIGFGDVLPTHPKFFLATSAYLLIGFSLIAMVINVFMEAVSDTIDKATDQIIQVGSRVREVKGLIAKATPGGRLGAAPPSSADVPIQLFSQRLTPHFRRQSL